MQSDAQKAKDYFTGKHIELSLRIRFINGDVHPVLIRKVNAQLMQRKRFGRAMPVDEFVKPLQTEITELLEQKGLSVSEQSLSDYYLFRWSLRMPVADDGTIVLSMLRWFVRIEMYALKYPPLQIDFAIHWSNGEGTMLTKIE